MVVAKPEGVPSLPGAAVGFAVGEDAAGGLALGAGAWVDAGPVMVAGTVGEPAVEESSSPQAASMAASKTSSAVRGTTRHSPRERDPESIPSSVRTPAADRG